MDSTFGRIHDFYLFFLQKISKFFLISFSFFFFFIWYSTTPIVWRTDGLTDRLTDGQTDKYKNSGPDYFVKVRKNILHCCSCIRPKVESMIFRFFFLKKKLKSGPGISQLIRSIEITLCALIFYFFWLHAVSETMRIILIEKQKILGEHIFHNLKSSTYNDHRACIWTKMTQWS